MNRSSLAAIVCLILAATCASADESLKLPPNLATRTFGHDWPDFLGPDRNGKSAETGLNFAWPDTGPPIVWQAKLGTSYGAPTISRGRLFHFDRHGDNDRLTCRNAETGKELWQLEHPTSYNDMLGYNNGPRCSPIVDGNLVFTFSAEGILQCGRVSNGERLWQLDTNKQFGVAKNFFGVASNPLVLGDLLIVNIGGSPPGGPEDVYSANGNVPGNGTGVVAFDKLTGKVRWQTSDELASYASPVATTMDGRPWCFVFARGGLVGLNPTSGKVDFTFPWRAKLLESVNASTPLVVSNEVFISETYGVGSALLQAKPSGYDIVWQDSPRQRDKAMMLHWNTPIYHDGYLYGSSGRHSNTAELRCVHWSTGKVAWSEPGLGRCSLLYADGHLIALAEDGTLMLLAATPEKFELKSKAILRDTKGHALLKPPAWAAPVLAQGLLYIRGDGGLVCLDLSKSD